MAVKLAAAAAGALAAAFVVLAADKAGVIELGQPESHRAGASAVAHGGDRATAPGDVAGTNRPGGETVAVAPMQETRPGAGGEKQPNPPRATAEGAPSAPYDQTRGQANAGRPGGTPQSSGAAADRPGGAGTDSQ